IRGRGQRAVGTLPQWRIGVVENRTLLRNIVQSADCGTAGIVVMKIPGRDLAIVAHTTANLDQTGGPEIRPRKLLLAGPNKLDRLPGRFRQAGSLHGGFACVLATVTRARVGNDDAHLFSGDVE